MSKWKPKEGERFWYLELDKGCTFEVYYDKYYSDYNYASKRVELGNCFETEVEALAMKKQIEKLLKGE